MMSTTLIRTTTEPARQFVEAIGSDRFDELMGMSGPARKKEIKRCFLSSAQSLLEAALLIWAAVRDGEDISEFERDRVEIYLHVAQGRLLFKLAEIADLTARPILGRRVSRLLADEQKKIIDAGGRVELVLFTTDGRFTYERRHIADLSPSEQKQVFSSRHDRLNTRAEQEHWLREHPQPAVHRAAKISASVSDEERLVFKEWCKRHGKNPGEFLRSLIVDHGIFKQ